MGLYPKIVSSNPPVLTRRYGSVEWFVDGANGSDSGSRPGNRPEKPLLTIAEAIDRCVNGEQNIINVIAPGHVTEVTPIVVDKQFVTIRGWPSQSPGGQSPCTLVAPTDTAYFTIAAQDVAIMDFTIHAGASWPAINFSPVAWSFRTVIHGITFKAGLYGIAQGALDGASGFVADAPSHGWSITNCIFAAPLSNGIMLASNGSWGLIADNFFESVGFGVYGHLNCQSAGVRVLRNQFMTPVDNVTGNAVYVGTQATRWIVADNDANDATNTANTNQPYYDQGNTSAWFRNTETHAGFTEAPPD